MAVEHCDYVLIFIDDGSTDDSALILAELADNDERVEAYLLSRNYGHQMALTCGLDNADGDVVITMDGDLQHPPELIPKMLDLWKDGHDIVQTKSLAMKKANFLSAIHLPCTTK
ncbi:MAG: glycosyltransferase [Phascolarctobacterium sp.]|nr:glycosyltransferase [Phascolarctobacterium sp.]